MPRAILTDSYIEDKKISIQSTKKNRMKGKVWFLKTTLKIHKFSALMNTDTQDFLCCCIESKYDQAWGDWEGILNSFMEFDGQFCHSGNLHSSTVPLFHMVSGWCSSFHRCRILKLGHVWLGKVGIPSVVGCFGIVGQHFYCYLVETSHGLKLESTAVPQTWFTFICRMCW